MAFFLVLTTKDHRHLQPRQTSGDQRKEYIFFLVPWIFEQLVRVCRSFSGRHILTTEMASLPSFHSFRSVLSDPNTANGDGNTLTTTVNEGDGSSVETAETAESRTEASGALITGVQSVRSVPDKAIQPQQADNTVSNPEMAKRYIALLLKIGDLNTIWVRLLDLVPRGCELITLIHISNSPAL